MPQTQQETDCPPGMERDWVDKTGDALTGLADGLSLGIGPWLRGMAGDAYPSLFGGIENGVDASSTSYEVGSWASVAIGMGRMAYAGGAKAASIFASSGMRASQIRAGMKTTFRLGFGAGWRAPNLAKYPTDAALRAAAGRTNTLVNAYGAGVAAAGAKGVGGCQPKKK